MSAKGQNASKKENIMLPPLETYAALRAKIGISGDEYWIGVMFHEGNLFHRYVGCHGRHSWEELPIAPRNVILLKVRRCISCDRVEAFGDWLRHPSAIGATEIILLIQQLDPKRIGENII